MEQSLLQMMDDIDKIMVKCTEIQEKGEVETHSKNKVMGL